MNTRLKQFLAAENITQSQFADKINVVRASVSHILSGRNNPSYDFIKALLEHFPTLNPDWLFFGKGKMYRDSEEPYKYHIAEGDPQLFADTEEIISDVPAEPEVISTSPTAREDSIETIQHIAKQRKVSKIIVLFDDGSYQEM